MKTTRRGFFAVLTAFALALWKDPEKLFRKPPAAPFRVPELLIHPRAVPGRIDFLNLKEWFRIETKVTGVFMENIAVPEGMFGEQGESHGSREH